MKMPFNSVKSYLYRPKYVLTRLGIWLPPTQYVFLHLAYKIIILLSQYTFILFEFIYIAEVWGDLEAVSEASHLLFTQASLCYKATVFITNKRNLRSLLEFMSCDVLAPKTKEHEHVHIYLNLPKLFLVPLGLWFSPKRYACFHAIYKILIMLSQYSFVLFEIMYIRSVWGDLEAMSDASFMLFTLVLVCYKGTDFIINKMNLKLLLKFMKCDTFAPKTTWEEKILLNNARKVKNLSMFFLINALLTCTMWAIIPLLEEERVFPFNIWMPVGPEQSPQYELGYTYQMTTIYISALIFFAVDGTTLAMVMYGCAQLEIIVDKIKKVEPVPNFTKFGNTNKAKIKIQKNNALMVECMQHHQKVIRIKVENEHSAPMIIVSDTKQDPNGNFIETLEYTYHANIFFQLCGTVGIICIIGLRISIEEPSSMQFHSMVIYMVTMLSQLFLYCWCGSELTIKSEVLRDCLYQCPWYEQDGNFKKCVFIAMERMKRPIIFKAGHYIPLSRPTFVLILRSSYSYFAVLNQANSK